MLPLDIVQQAKIKKLDIIGISDHNSAENVIAVKKAGAKAGIEVWGGMEITSSEEAHVLALFGDSKSLRQIQKIVYQNLAGENDAKTFGQQIVVDSHDQPRAINEKLLIGATALTIDKIVEIIHSLGGLAIASHVDRESFSVIGQLGLIPADLKLDALELSRNCPESAKEKYQEYKLPLVTFSDAHYLTDIGASFTTLMLKAPTFAEAVKAFHGQGGRKVRSG
jgi:predicted metal-dependent phosphoesterase TrpH